MNGNDEYPFNGYITLRINVRASDCFLLPIAGSRILLCVVLAVVCIHLHSVSWFPCDDK